MHTDMHKDGLDQIFVKAARIRNNILRKLLRLKFKCNYLLLFVRFLIQRTIPENETNTQPHSPYN
jgi:hypothetical protein